MPFGSLYVPVHKPTWFRLINVVDNTLPVAVIENLTEADLDFEIESSDVVEGTLTTLMTPVTIKPGGTIRTDVPKIPSGQNASEKSWCKATVSNYTKPGHVKITLHGRGTLQLDQTRV